MLAAILGFITGMAPKIITMIQEGQQRAHDYKMAKLELEKLEMQTTANFRLAEVDADKSEFRVVHDHDPMMQGTSTLANIANFSRAIIRPVGAIIAYVCIIGALADIFNVPAWIVPLVEVIIGFYFGDRALTKHGLNSPRLPGYKIVGTSGAAGVVTDPAVDVTEPHSAPVTHEGGTADPQWWNPGTGGEPAGGR